MDFRRSCRQAQSWFYNYTEQGWTVMNPRAMFAAKPLSTTTCKKQVVVLSGLVEAGGWDLQAAEGSAVPKVHLISLRCPPSDLWIV